MKEVQIAEDQSKTTLVFEVPESVVNLLNAYIIDESINLDKFIESAIKKYYGRVMVNTYLSIDYNDYEEETLPIKVSIEKGLADDLSIRAIVAHSSLSAILIEVLFNAFEDIDFALHIINWYGYNSILKDEFQHGWWCLE